MPERTYLRWQGRNPRVRSELMVGKLVDEFRSGIDLMPTHTEGTITWAMFVVQVQSTPRSGA